MVWKEAEGFVDEIVEGGGFSVVVVFVAESEHS